MKFNKNFILNQIIEWQVSKKIRLKTHDIKSLELWTIDSYNWVLSQLSNSLTPLPTPQLLMREEMQFFGQFAELASAHAFPDPLCLAGNYIITWHFNWTI